MVRKGFVLGVALVALLVLLWVTGNAVAGPPLEGPEGDVSIAATVGSKISYQGRLTDSDGNPLDGTYSMQFQLYDAQSGGTMLWDSGAQSVQVANGLFNVELDVDQPDFNGQELWLRIGVGAEWLTPRQEILPVPYALSLRPGAEIKGELDDPILYVYNTGSGSGLWGTSLASTGIHGSSWDGTGVYGSSLSGTGVYARSLSGAAIAAEGTGVITSTAKSYVWISGNDLRKKYSTDTTQFECDLYGGVKVTRGADPGTKDVMLPVILPGQLYGQNVTLTGIDVYFKSQSDFDGIGVTAVRRQTEAGSGDLIRWDDTDRACPVGTACSYHLDFTTNNVLSDEHGVVYIALQLFFAGPSSYVQIGGVRLTLEHD